MARNLVSQSLCVVADAAVKPRRSLPWAMGVAESATANAETAGIRRVFSTTLWLC